MTIYLFVIHHQITPINFLLCVMGNFGSKTKLPTYPNLSVKNFPKNDDGESITLNDNRKLGYKEYNYKHYYNEKLINPSKKKKEHVILLIPGLPGSRFF